MPQGSVCGKSKPSFTFGCKRRTRIRNALKLIYQYEVGVNPADNAKPILSQRNAFVGVKGGFGQIIMGNFDTR